MSNPTFEDAYSEQSFWHKIRTLADRIGKELLEKVLWLYYVTQDKAVPLHVKAQIYGILGYFVMPLDAIPDSLPLIGYSDDLSLIAITVANVALYITPEIKQKTRERLSLWFS